MSKNNRNRNQTQLLNEQQQPGVPMEQSSTPAIDTKAQAAQAAANEPKSTPTARVGGESNTPSDKKKDDKKDNQFIDVITYIPRKVWNDGIIPVWNLGKGMTLKAWDKTKATFENEKAYASSQGPAKYLLDRIATLGLKVLKLAAVFTLATFLAKLAMSSFGIALFSPAVMITVAIVALLCMVIRSYMIQKETSTEVSAKTFGNHIVEQMCAA